MSKPDLPDFVLTPAQRDTLISKALEARLSAYSPKVGFRVGACILVHQEEGDERDPYIMGANTTFTIGNACAERNAVYRAATGGYRRILAVAVSSDTRVGISPCGFCRQVTLDFCSPSTPFFLVPASYVAPIAGVEKDAAEDFVTLQECKFGKPLDRVIVTSHGELLPCPYSDVDYLAPRPEGLQDVRQFMG